MRIVSLLLLLILIQGLSAQIQVLPDMEITGESNVKIFLYKKALPYSFESTLADSLSNYLPLELPAKQQLMMGQKPAVMRHFLQLEANTRLAADAVYRYHPLNAQIDALGIAASFKSPKSELLSRHITFGADLALQHDWKLRSQMHYYINEASNMQSQYLMGQMLLRAEDMELGGLGFSEMTNEVRLHSFEQENLSITYRNDGLAWHHHSSLQIMDQELDNAIFLYGDKAAVHSALSLPNGAFDSSSVHLIYDGYHLMPSLGFRYTLEAGFDQIFSVANEPQSMANDFLEPLDQYRWLTFAESRRNTSMPLNLELKYQLINPFDHDFNLAAFTAQSRNRYYKYLPMLRDGVSADVPELYYADVFENCRRIQASFGKAPFTLEQSAELSLAYLTNQNWRPKAYNPLLKVETRAVYDRAPYCFSVSFAQHYFSKDEHRNKLPELLDLSVSAAYHIGDFSKVYLEAGNILNADKWQHRALPKEAAALHLGLIHRF